MKKRKNENERLERNGRYTHLRLATSYDGYTQMQSWTNYKA